MKQQKETSTSVGACSVLALGRPGSMTHTMSPTNYSSPEDEIHRKFMPYYAPDAMSYSPTSIMDPLSITEGNYYYYPPLFSFGTPNALSPEVSSSPETCSDLDLTDSFTHDSPPSGFTSPSLSIKMESQGSLGHEHDYNMALSLAKDIPFSHLNPYSTQGPMISHPLDCFTMPGAEASFVGVMPPSPISQGKLSSSTADQLFDIDTKSFFPRDLTSLDARDYFSTAVDNLASDAARRKSLDDAIFLRKIASTPVKSEVAFQQHNRRKSLPGDLTQRLHIETLSPTKQPRKSSKSLAPFACPHEHCPKTFTRQYNLKSHLRTHTDERPFVCNYPGCPRAFARQHDLKRHQKLHLGLKPHVCQNCGRAFARLDALNRHLRSDNAAQCAQATLASNAAGKLFKSANI
ncbi:11926_t:CDS:2 [Funneliformis caledonium]|uniref:11926_t:CDS:1 n=1 Tax=Funneliformis caledonium TaxID=1117310 RepID=A0A9N8W7Z7_9GLOM|nr:11926_t:CDS:2 [Funneliformis caledonium]